MLVKAPRLSLDERVIKDNRWPDHRYKCWFVYGSDGKGGRIQKKFQDETKARLWKGAKEIELANVQNRTRHVQTTLTLEQLSEAEGCIARLKIRYTLTQAVDYFLQHFHEPEFKIRFSEASVKFRGALEGQVRDRTLVQLKSTLGQFEKFVGDCYLHEVTGKDVERYLKTLRARDGSNAASRKTWNNYRGDLHLFFEWCADRQRRWVPNNPASEVDRFQIDREHIEILSAEQARVLMNTVADFKSGKLIRYFALALFAGVRPGGELEKLAGNPQLIDLDNEVVRITEAISKTRKPRQIKIRPNLYRWLIQYPTEILPANCDRELKAIRKRLRLSHDVLRHTFISMHVGAFKSFADAAIESGNSEKIIRDHYLNTSSFKDAQRFWNIFPEDADQKVVHLA
jgi:site-specific recombinase XerD